MRKRLPMKVMGLTIKDIKWGWAMDTFLLLLLPITPIWWSHWKEGGARHQPYNGYESSMGLILFHEGCGSYGPTPYGSGYGSGYVLDYSPMDQSFYYDVYDGGRYSGGVYGGGYVGSLMDEATSSKWTAPKTSFTTTGPRSSIGYTSS